MFLGQVGCQQGAMYLPKYLHNGTPGMRGTFIHHHSTHLSLGFYSPKKRDRLISKYGENIYLLLSNDIDCNIIQLQQLLKMLSCYTDGVTWTTRYRMIIATLYS